MPVVTIHTVHFYKWIDECIETKLWLHEIVSDMEEMTLPNMFGFEEYGLLNCNALYWRDCPMFQRNKLHPSWPWDEGDMFL
jgi:hypothetical protein